MIRPDILSVLCGIFVALHSYANASAAQIYFDVQKITDEEIKLVAGRVRDGLIGKSSQAEKEVKRDESAESRVHELLAAQNRQTDSELYGSFSEVKQKDPQDIDFARGYFDPIRELALAYSSPASRFYHRPEVKEAMHVAFSYTRKHVYPKCPKPGNWWVWAKQMPDCLVDILALMTREFEPEGRQYITSVLDYLLGTGPIPGNGHHHGKPGKDALNSLVVGIVSEDRKRIARGWECMENEVSPYLLEADGTPLMSLLTKEFLGVSLPYVYEGYDTVVEWAKLTQGTSMALRPETTGKITCYLLDLGRWNTFEGTEVAGISFTSYRVFWRPPTTHALAARVAEFDAEHATALKAMAEGKDIEPDGCRFWPTAETVIFRLPKLYAGLVMASKPRHQISWSYKNYFLHIGSKWYYERDGHLILARNAAETDPNLTYTHDWQRLTGVTHDDGSVLESKQFNRGTNGYFQPGYIRCENPMAGAAILDGRDGVAGIELHAGMTRARKSYFFLHDQQAIVMLGSDIRGRGPTTTTLHTVPVSNGPVSVWVKGKTLELTEGTPVRIKTPAWIHGPGGSYWFPEKGSVTLLTETRKPDFEDHGDPAQQPTVPAQKFVSIFVDHGKNPMEACYAAVLFPLAAAADMPALSRAFASECKIKRSEVGHFLRLGSLTMAAFFQPGNLEGYQVDRPCFVALRRNERAVHLATYEPSWKDATLQIQLPFSASGTSLPANCRVDGKTLVIDTKPAQAVECQLTAKRK